MILPIEQWEALDRARPAPTFFARPAFARALAQTYPHLQPAAHQIECDGECFLVPTVRTSARLRPSETVAFPFGGYSCVLDEQGRAVDGTRSVPALRELAARCGALDFVAWPLADQPVIDGFDAVRYETAVIDCKDGVESALAGMRGVTRRMVGQAHRRGVQCERHETDARNLDIYYAMLQEASIGWGLREPTIPRRLLGAVAQAGGEDVELWFAMLEGRPIAGGVVLFGRDELFFWSAAMRRDFSTYRPSNALNARLIERACERGVRWYNLGASEGLSGVERFKTDLGARPLSYVRLLARKPSYRAYLALRNVMKARVAS